MVDPIKIVNKYEGEVYRSGQTDRFFITHKCVGTGVTDEEARHLAREALWLVAKENPKAPVTTILHKAKQLYSRFLREDYLSTFAQMAFKKRNTNKTEYFARVDDIIYPTDRTELESEVYNCLDLIIRNWGVHLGLWVILSYALQDSQTKARTIYKYMGIQPTRKQEKAAASIIQKLKTLL